MRVGELRLQADDVLPSDVREERAALDGALSY